MPVQNSWALGTSVGGNYGSSAFLNSKLKVPQELKNCGFFVFYQRGGGGLLESCKWIRSMCGIQESVVPVWLLGDGILQLVQKSSKTT